MGKMFKTVTATFNPFTGCRFDCSYCWAKKLALGKCKYPNFEPTFHPERLNKKFKADDFVFVSSMGDIAWSKWRELESILAVISASPARFLLQTKAPDIFLNGLVWGDNIYHGCTIETNRLVPMSKAPAPIARYHNMAVNTHPHRFLSIEPIMDFDLDVFTSWVLDIKPEIIEIGTDNYHNNLPEPPPEKLKEFIGRLTVAGLNVKQKDGLSRLLEAKK